VAKSDVDKVEFVIGCRDSGNRDEMPDAFNSIDLDAVVMLVIEDRPVF
jgi:hypothetical protein